MGDANKWLIAWLLAIVMVPQAVAAQPERESASQPSVGALLAELGDGDWGKRRDALGLLKARGAKAIPELARALEGPHAIEAACALGQMGEAAAPALIGGLGTNDDLVRRFVRRSLWLVGEAAVPGLRKALSDPRPRVRVAAAIVLGAIGKPAAEAVQDLVVLTKDANAEVRRYAMVALTNLGAATAAIPHLSRGLRDEDSKVRQAAAWRLARAGKPGVSALREALKDSGPTVRALAAGALEEAGEPGEEAIPGLIAALDDPDARVREAAAFALNAFGVRLKAAIPILTEVLRRDTRRSDSPDAMDAAYVLSRFGERAVPDLMSIVRDAKAAEHARDCAALALSRTGSWSAVTALRESLKAEDPNVRRLAAMSFASMGPSAMEALPQLAFALADDDPRVRAHAAVAVGNSGLLIQDIPSRLMKRVTEDPDARVRAAAVYALGYAREGAFDSSKVLLGAMRDEDATVRSAAALALGQMRAPTEDVVAVLAATLKDGSVAVRAAAAEALGFIGKPATSAIPDLRAADAADPGAPDACVGSAAREALYRIQAERETPLPDLVWNLWMDLGPAAGNAADALRYEGKGAVPLLVHVLRYGRRPFFKAVEVIRYIGPAATEAAPVLPSVFADEGLACVHAVAALGRIGAPARMATLDLVQQLECGGESAAEAVDALANMWEEDAVIVRPLVGALKSIDVEVRLRAALVLSQRYPQAAELAPALEDALDDEPLSDWIDSDVMNRLAYPRDDGLGIKEEIAAAKRRYQEAIAKALKACVAGPPTPSAPPP